MNASTEYAIRPAGRHLLTIGRDLIQDEIAAIVELVKNAFDADSPLVTIRFSVANSAKDFKIEIEDKGHGMSRETVINSWLVPSTDDKLRRKVSPGGRVMQGRKGVGRYAASILGDDLLLETTTTDGEFTSLYVQWDDFEKARYLDEVKLTVATKEVTDPAGTKLTITGGREHCAIWSTQQLRKLKHELKKLVSPLDDAVSASQDQVGFAIYLEYSGFADSYGRTTRERVDPFPIFALYDYRISGEIDSNGKGQLRYACRKHNDSRDEVIDFDLASPTQCGRLTLDIRVYDRDKDAIDQLIRRGLKDDKGAYLGKLEARQILNEANGIGVYRNGFRIRPLGDSDFDWLRLNEQRVQNPSLRIGSNQVIGYVQIESEELSNLKEKSARDGLRDNSAYTSLRDIVRRVIAELETRRFESRRRTGLKKSGLKIETELEKLFQFDELKSGVREKLKRRGVDESTAEEVIEIISSDEDSRNRLAEEVRQTVAIYQGQATLGKIINVILHEARRPLNYFKNQIPNIDFWVTELRSDYRPEILDELIPITEGIGRNARIFVDLFGRLDPLAAGRRNPRKEFKLKRTIEEAIGVFESDLIESGITIRVSGPDDLVFSGWPQDFYAIFTNLVDNSIYWIKEAKSKPKRIDVTIFGEKGTFARVDYTDSGPGIAKHLLDDDVIFDPEFSTKPGGHGLGLAIAGEAASRNGLVLHALESNSGAYFCLQPSTKRE